MLTALARVAAWILPFALAGAVAATASVVTPVRVAGMSMAPTLGIGDIVFVSRSGVSRTGDVALIARPGRGRALHRLIGKASDGRWVVRGDANPIPDLEPVPKEEIAGRVVAVVPVSRALGKWRQASGR
jgi:signal peptidase I